MELIFYISGAVAVAATLMVVTRRNAVHALMYMVLAMLAVAMVFFAMGAQLAAALEVIIFAGAIMVLFVFVVMMLDLGPGDPLAKRKFSWWLPGLLATVLLAELIYATSGEGLPPLPLGNEVTPRAVGLSLFGKYALVAELASMLLLSALVGAFHLAHRAQSREDQP